MNAAIHNAQPNLNAKLSAWRHQFRFYRDPPDEARISEWLRNFENKDIPVMAKVLDRITVIGESDIQSGYRSALESVPGWHHDAVRRHGRWFFVGFGRPGESGPAMLRLFREANNLAYARYDQIFISLSDLPSLKLTANDTVMFVDDFSGSGRQATRMWPKVAELVASEANCYLVVTALTTVARESIEGQTDLKVCFRYLLGPEHALFHPDNTEFSALEKNVVERYCAVANPHQPRGYGGLGIMFVLYHKTSNNCLPIIYVNERHWRGILPRYLKAE